MMRHAPSRRARRRAAATTTTISGGGGDSSSDLGGGDVAFIRPLIKTQEEKQLLKEMKYLVQHDEWQNPMGGSLYCAAASLLAGTFNPVMHRCSEYLQTDDPMWIPELYESHYNIICLYYSLVGVLSIEVSFLLQQQDANDTLYLISSFCWAASILWSMGGVVCAFHVIWSIHATPINERRQFINDNTFAFSAVYSLGSANFVLVNIGAFTGVLSHAQRQPGQYAFHVALAGLLLGFLVEGVFLFCAGLVTVQSMRPWKVAHERLKAKNKLPETRNSTTATIGASGQQQQQQQQHQQQQSQSEFSNNSMRESRPFMAKSTSFYSFNNHNNNNSSSRGKSLFLWTKKASRRNNAIETPSPSSSSSLGRGISGNNTERNHGLSYRRTSYDRHLPSTIGEEDDDNDDDLENPNMDIIDDKSTTMDDLVFDNERSKSISMEQAMMSTWHQKGVPIDEVIKLQRASLELEELQDPNLDTMFIDRLLVDANITSPGHRLAIVRLVKGTQLNYFGLSMESKASGLDLQRMG